MLIDFVTMLVICSESNNPLTTAVFKCYLAPVFPLSGIFFTLILPMWELKSDKGRDTQHLNFGQKHTNIIKRV